MRPPTTWSVALLLSIILTACSPTAGPLDHHPAGTPVLLNAGVEKGETFTNMDFQLGPRTSQLFLDMLTNTPAQTNASGARHIGVASNGVFIVGGTKYVWLYESVFRDGRWWTGPLMDRLSRDGSLYGVDYLREILGKIEADPNIVNLSSREEWLLDTKQRLIDRGPPTVNDMRRQEWISELYIFFENGWASYEVSLGCMMGSSFDGALLLAADGTFYLSAHHYCVGFDLYYEGPQPRDLAHFLELYGTKYGWRKL